MRANHARRKSLGLMLIGLAVAAASATWLGLQAYSQHFRELQICRGHSEMIFTVAVSPDGARALSGAGGSYSGGKIVDCVARLWDLSTGKELGQLVGHEGAVLTVAISPDGLHAITGSEDGTIRLWHLSSCELLAVWTGHRAAVWSVVFSPDGKYVLSGSQDTSVVLWEARTGQIVRRLTGHRSKVNSVAFSPDGRRVASGSSDGSLCVWDATTGRESARREGLGPIYSVAFPPAGEQLASGGAANLLRLHDARCGQVIREIPGHAGGILCVAFTGDGRRIVSSGCFTGDDHTVRLWDAPTGRQLGVYTGHTGSVNAIAIVPRGDVVVTAAGDRTVRVLRLRSN